MCDDEPEFCVEKTCTVETKLLVSVADFKKHKNHETKTMTEVKALMAL
jgi:hypothetical protein